MADDSIIWRVNRTPRFPALPLGEYMVADDGPRETMRRNMKFERMAQTLFYRELQQAVVSYLASPTRDLRILDRCRATLEDARDRATKPTVRDNATYALRSLETFERSLNRLPVGGLTLTRPPVFKPLEISGVNVSIQPSVLVRLPRPRGKPLVGAIIIDTAKGTEPKTTEAKRRAKEAMTHTAYLLHELVVAKVAGDDEKPSPEHCAVFHSYRGQYVQSPANYRKPLRNMEAACRGIAREWDDIEPPATFDPKRARYRR